MHEFQEFPKALFGPNGEEAIAEDAEQEAAILADWHDAPDLEDEPAPVVHTPAPRPRGRPPKGR